MYSSQMNIAVSAQAGAETIARELATKLALPLIDSNWALYDFVLVQTMARLELVRPGSDEKPFCIDFTQGKAKYRTHVSQQLAHPLVKAIGLKAYYRPLVLDTTAGMGDDAYLLANLGCRVIMLERHPVIAALLADALLRLDEPNIDLTLQTTDAIKFMSHMDFQPDVVICDPMFPHTNKSAKVKKSMQILQSMVGMDEDSNKVLNLALTKASKRVVVKRPNHANFLADITPNHSIKTKNHRFDVYLSIEVTQKNNT